MKSRYLILALTGAALLSPLAATPSYAAKPPGASLQLFAGNAELLRGEPVRVVVASNDCRMYKQGDVKTDGGREDVLAFNEPYGLSVCVPEYILGGELKTIEISSSPVQATVRFALKPIEAMPGPCAYTFSDKLVGKVAEQSPLSIDIEAIGRLRRKESNIFCAGAYVGHFTVTLENLNEAPVSLQVSFPAEETPREGTPPVESGE